MKKVFGFIFSVICVLLMSSSFSSTAEAARVAVVPIQIDEQQVDRAADFTGYYWDIMIQSFKYPEYELMDDEKVEAVLPEEGLKDFSQAALANLCTKTDAEIVVAMRLDNMDQHIMNFRREQTLATFMKGEFASYNRLTGKYFHKNIYEKGEIEEVLTLRNDWKQNTFASELKRCINRTLEDKTKPNKKQSKKQKMF